MRSSCEASATNSRWRASVGLGLPARLVEREEHALQRDAPARTTSSSDSGCGIVSDGSRVRAIARAASVSRGDRRHRAGRGGQPGEQRQRRAAEHAEPEEDAARGSPSPRRRRSGARTGRRTVPTLVGDRPRLDPVAVVLLGRRSAAAAGTGAFVVVRDHVAVRGHDADHRVLARRRSRRGPGSSLASRDAVACRSRSTSRSWIDFFSSSAAPRDLAVEVRLDAAASSARRRSSRSRAGSRASARPSRRRAASGSAAAYTRRT